MSNILDSQEPIQKVQSNHINTATTYDEDGYKKLQHKYDGFKNSLKSEKDEELPMILNELQREINEVHQRVLTDQKHVQMLFNQYLPEYMKTFLQRRYMIREAESQMLITQFINMWMLIRVPRICDIFFNKKHEGDGVSFISFPREIEILELIFDDVQEMYNYRMSKNNAEIEDRLSLLLQQSFSQPKTDFQDGPVVQNLTEDSKMELDEIKKDVAFIKKPSFTSHYFIHNMNFFGRVGGFDQLINILEAPQKSQLKPTFHNYLSVLNILTSMKSNFYNHFWLEYVELIKSACWSYVKNTIQQEDLRSVSRREFQFFTNYLESILESTLAQGDIKSEKVYQFTEQIELMLALKCLQMPVLEKKLIGHQILQIKISQVRSQQSSQIQIARNINVALNQRWLNSERLTGWMDQEKIFELVFGESLHSEVIKKCQALIQFLYQNGRIQEAEMDIMWDCATKKHEAYKVAIIKALTFLTTKASLNHIKYLFQKLKSLQMSEVDKFSLAFIKSISRRLSVDGDNTQDRPSNLINNGGTHQPRSNSFSNRNIKNTQGANQNIQNPSNDDIVMFEENDDQFDGGFKNRNKGKIEGGMHEHGNFAHDDMTRPLRFPDNGKSGKKTRSLSLGGEKDGKKGVSSLVSKISEARSQAKKLQKVDSKMNPQVLEQEEIKAENSERQIQNQQVEEVNPLDVPAEKEDKKTADEEGSAGGANFEEQHLDTRENDLFENVPIQIAQSQKNNIQEVIQPRKKKESQDLEEEKGDGSGQRIIQTSLHELIYDDSLGIENLEKRELAHHVLNYIWSLCLEDSVSDHGLSLQSHKIAIDHLVQILLYHYQHAIFLYIQKCVTCLQHNFSVLSVQIVLQKILSGISFPITFAKNLPKNRVELLQKLEEELNITNECLSSYIEFKRISLSFVFDQLGSQEQEQENLETQSSLDNDDERSSMQSAQKNNTQETPQQICQKPEPIQIDILTQKESSGSLFLSPRARMEEEFKVFIPGKTQSYQGDMIQTQTFQKNHDFGLQVNQELEDRSQKNISSQIGQLGGTGQKHFGSSAKRGQQQQHSQFYQNQMKNEIQQQLPQLNNDTREMPPPENQQVNSNNNNRDFLNSLITNEVYKYSYYQEMQHRLDFLKFMIGNCPGILKPQQIQVLWECLVINAFYEKERDMFFQWCTQILKSAQSLPGAKDQDQMGASIFKEDCMEMLFFDTLLKLDFRYITDIMYECFEKFLVYINESYGQIVTNNAFDSAFEVFETKLIGVEGLWEIALCVRDEKVYKKAADFLHKLYKKMSPSLIEKLNEIKEDLLQTCMEQIKTGLNDINQEIGDAYDVPISQFATTIEDPKNRIARSIQQLCKFIDEFEGLRDRGAKSQLGSSDKDCKIICNNQIGSSQGPKKVELSIPSSTKIGEIREQVAKSIVPPRQTKEISLLFKGKDLVEDLKTLKDLGISHEQQATFIVSLRNQFEMDQMEKIDDKLENEGMEDMIENIKSFLGELDLPLPVLKLAIKKCNMNIEEIVVMITDEQAVNDLQEEVRKQEESNQQIALLQVEEQKVEEGKKEESKLNLIISNKSEYFELLFELLNLGINEITNAAWNLLVQIPVNKQLLHQIKTLNNVHQGSSSWNSVIDSTNVYKMLYSLQILNSLISVNNDSLSEAEIQERFEWRQRFLELGGFDHLYQILIQSDVDDLLGNQQASNIILQTKMIGQAAKRKTKQLKVKHAQPLQTNQDQKDQIQIQNNSAKCLGYLISIVKIFLQAALLTTDDERLFTLIVQSSTSPFRKPKNIKSALSSVPPNKINQILFQNSGSANNINDSSREDQSRDNSSVNTPKFHSSHSSKTNTPQGSQTPIEEGQKTVGKEQNKSLDILKADTVSQQTFSKQPNNQQLYTQIDDFPKLVDQMSQGFAQSLLDKVVNFNELISKLLHIIYKTVMFCESQDASQLVQNSLDLLLPCVVWMPSLLLKEIYEFEHLESLLIRTLMFNQNENVRKSLEKTFRVICLELDLKSQKQNDYGNQNIESPKFYILKLLLKNLPDINLKSDQCEEYFNLVTSLLKECHSHFKLTNQDHFAQMKIDQIILEDGSFSSNALLSWCIHQLSQRPTYEDRYSQYTDKVLAGYLHLTQSVLEINPELKKPVKNENGKIDENDNLVKMIFDFLFLLPSLEEQQIKHSKALNGNEILQQDTYPKCKRKFTRKKAFNLLLRLCHQCEENYIELLKQLYQFHAQIQKSQKVVNLSEFDNEVGVRSATGYVGLKNFGCTCYMNSLIQQLFMIPDLRKGVLEADLNDSDIEENLLYQLKLIFANLQESEKQYYAPSGFTKTFKFYGEPINVRIQQDTHEFYNLLCDNLENLLKGTPQERLLKDTIGGVICNETKSLEKEHPYIGEREEPFFAITLDIKNKKNIIEALDLYVKPDVLEGDNKYLCEKYDKKINAQRRSYLKRLSNTMIINLKRFEFDYSSMQRLKVNDYCEFPMKLNFKPWTKEGIRERELKENKKQDLKNKIDGVVEEDEEQVKIEEEEIDDQHSESNEDLLINNDGVNSDSSESNQHEEIKRGGDAIDEEMESVEEEFESAQNLNTGEYIDDGVDYIMDIPENEEDDLNGNKSIRKQPGTATSRPQKKGLKKGAIKIKDQKKTHISKNLPKKKPPKKQQKDDNYYEYELVGVLVHSGSADAGHYYSFIKDRDKPNRWLEFNDTYVREFDLKNLENECFGGNHDIRGNQPSSGAFYDDFNPADGRFFERCRNAYLLFYERVNQNNQAKIQESTMIQSAKKKFINGIESSIYQRIWEENAAFMKLKIFFDQEYFQFIRDYVNLYNFENVLYFSQEHSESFKFKKLKELTDQYKKEQLPNLTQDYKIQQLEIEKQAKRTGELDIFQDWEKITEDPGLYTLKLATILSQDIITKVKDVQSFVQWMQLMNQLYERHAVACVWFIKYMTENRGILEELLLNNQYFEVRENFAKLLMTAISVTAKNEENYFQEFEEINDFDCDLKQIQNDLVDKAKVSKASVIRFMDLYFNQMLETTRVHWRRFDDYFQVLQNFALNRFNETKYLISQKAITKLIEFTMNGSAPFYSNIKFKMGDRVNDPNFNLVLDILSQLIKSCLTVGVQQVNLYSTTSIYQTEDKHIPLPLNEVQPLLTKECFSCDLLQKMNSNSSLKTILIHLSWGDIDNSKFFIEEILESLKQKRTIMNELDNHFKLLGSILKLNDDLQEQRLIIAFNFEGFSTTPLITYLFNMRNIYQIFVLKALNFIGELCETDAKILGFIRKFEYLFKEWVFTFLQNVSDDRGTISFAASVQVNLPQVVQSTYEYYLKMFNGPVFVPQNQNSSAPLQDEEMMIDTSTNKQFSGAAPDLKQQDSDDFPLNASNRNINLDTSFKMNEDVNEMNLDLDINQLKEQENHEKDNILDDLFNNHQ